MRISEFRACHILASAVHSQLGNPSIDELADTLSDVRGHGADGGFHGFIYYSDTIAFTKRHRDTILATIREDCFSMGERDPVTFVLGFRCVKDADVSPESVAVALYGNRNPGVPIEDLDIVRNGLAWYALESVAHAAETCGD